MSFQQLNFKMSFLKKKKSVFISQYMKYIIYEVLCHNATLHVFTVISLIISFLNVFYIAHLGPP